MKRGKRRDPGAIVRGLGSLSRACIDDNWFSGVLSSRSQIVIQLLLPCRDLFENLRSSYTLSSANYANLRERFCFTQQVLWTLTRRHQSLSWHDGRTGANHPSPVCNRQACGEEWFRWESLAKSAKAQRYLLQLSRRERRGAEVICHQGHQDTKTEYWTKNLSDGLTATGSQAGKKTQSLKWISKCYIFAKSIPMRHADTYISGNYFVNTEFWISVFNVELYNV
mgnify:FL=1